METHAVDVDGSWSIGGKPHGGYLLAMMAGLALDDEHPHPMAVSAHFVASPDEGAATVEVERLRTGRRVASSRLRLTQDGVVRVEALLSSGTCREGAEPFWSDASAPDLAPVDEWAATPTQIPGGPRVGHLDHVEVRQDPATYGWAFGAPGGSPEVRAWLRRRDEAPPSVLDLLVLSDALPPLTFDLGVPGWAPTLELTVLVRGLPAPGWIRGVQRTRLLVDGWLDEECELWDSEGRLVAQSRQLAGYRLP